MASSKSQPEPYCFAGRGVVLHNIVDMLIGTNDMDRRDVVIRGEAGIGKTELLGRVLEVARSQNHGVVHLRSDELGRGVPYAAFRDAIARVGSEHRSDLILVNAVHEALDASSPSAVPSIHGASARLFSAMRSRQPVVIAVDDLPLLDEDTLVLLADLVRRHEEHPVSVLVTVRAPESMRSLTVERFLERLEHDRRLEDLVLEALDRAATADLCRSLIGAAPHDDLVELVWRQSGGNPFFARQAVLNLREAGAIDLADEGEALLRSEPDGLSSDRRRDVLSRVLRVGDEARRLSRALALLDSSPVQRFEVAAGLATLTTDQASDAFDTLVDRGILRVEPDGHFRFSHQLVRDALYQSIGPAERLKWHRIVAAHLSQLPSSAGVDIEVARHYRECGLPGDDAAIAAMTRAGERACASAPRTSVPWFQQAISLAPADHPDRPQIVLRLARALLLSGRPQAAANVGRDGLDQIPDSEIRSRLLSLVIESLLELSAPREAARLLDREQLTGRPQSARLLGQSAHVLAMCDRLKDAREVGVRARAAGTTSLADRVIVLIHLAHVHMADQDYPAVRRVWAELDEVAAEAPASSQIIAYSGLSYSQALAGESFLCSRSIDRAQGALRASGWGITRPDLAAARVQHLASVGDWDASLAAARGAIEELENAGAHSTLATVRHVMAELLANRSQWDAARSILGPRLGSDDPHAPLLVWASAGIEMLSGGLAEARTVLESQLSEPITRGGLRARLFARLAEVELLDGNREGAKALVADLAQLGTDQIDIPTLIACKLAYGQAARDTAPLEAARCLADEYGLALLQGRARLCLGALDVDPAQNLGDAVVAFHRLGASLWRRKANVELQARGLKVPRPRARSSQLLTDTETHVALLIQQGRTNREVAESMFLSAKTVEGYLSRIYGKVGCSTRLELARAVDAGLLGPVEADECVAEPPRTSLAHR